MSALDADRLARVLGVLTESPEAWWREALAAFGADHIGLAYGRGGFRAVCTSPHNPHVEATARWRTDWEGRAAAREALVTAELLPAAWGAGCPWSFVCDDCEGTGYPPLSEYGPCACEGSGFVEEVGTIDLATLAVRMPALLAADAVLAASRYGGGYHAWQTVSQDMLARLAAADGAPGRAAMTRDAVGDETAAGLLAYDVGAYWKRWRWSDGGPRDTLVLLIPDALPWNR